MEVSRLQNEWDTYRQHADSTSQSTAFPNSEDMANLKEYIKKLEIENKSLKDKLASEKQSTKEAYQQLTEAKLS